MAAGPGAAGVEEEEEEEAAANVNGTGEIMRLGLLLP